MALAIRRIGEWPERHFAASFFVLLALGVAGAVVGSNVSVDRLSPRVRAVLGVHADLPGIDAATVEEVVTKPLEHAFASLPSVHDVESHSREGGADIFLEFPDDVDRGATLTRARALIERSTASLPRGMKMPAAAFEGAPVPPAAVYLVNAATESKELRRWISNVFVDPLREVPEIESVSVKGIVPAEIRIQPEPRRLAALGLAFDDLIEAVRRGDSVSRRRPARGQVVTSASVEAIAARPVRLSNGESVALGEVADVSSASGAATGRAHYNSASELRIIIYPRVRADAARAAERAASHLAWLRANGLVPSDVRIATQYNESRALGYWLKHVLLLVVACVVVILTVLGTLFGKHRVAASTAAFAVWSVVSVAAIASIGRVLNVASTGGLVLAAAPFSTMLVSRFVSADLWRVVVVGALSWVIALTLLSSGSASTAFLVGVVAAALVRWLMTPWLFRVGAESPGGWRLRHRNAVVGVAAALTLIAAGVCSYVLAAEHSGNSAGTFSFRLRGSDPQRLRDIVDPMIVSLHVIANVDRIAASTQLAETWRLKLDPARMEVVGIGLAAIGRAFAIAREGLIVDEVTDAEKQSALRMQLAPGAAGESFERLLLRGESNGQPAIYLRHVGTAQKALMPVERVRVDGEPAVTITAAWLGADAREGLQDFCGRVDVPEHYRLDCILRHSPY